jgi:integrase
MPRRNTGPRLQFLAKRGVFYIVWYERGRRGERSTGTRDIAEAQIVFAEFLRRHRQTGPSDPAEILLTDILADYAEDRCQDTAAPERIAYAIDPLSGFWEARTVADVTRKTCRAYALARDKSAGTVRRELGVLRAAINHAHREGRITRSVAVHLPDRPAPKERWLTRSEAARLLKAAMQEPSVRLYLPIFILIGLGTGQRKQAILNLRWAQIDLVAGRVDFNTPGSRRTNKRKSRIPIPARLLGHLRRARRRGTDLGFVVSLDGAKIGDIKRGFAGAATRAGLTGVTPHTLRHTAATWLLQAGVPIWEASGFLSMSQETLERTYGHHAPDFMGRAAKALS